MPTATPSALPLPVAGDPRRETPTFVFAYANDRHDESRFLRNLSEERRRIKQALQGARDQGRSPWVGSGGVNVLGPPRALEAECRRYEAERKWPELVPCADKLISVGHPNGPELRIRAVMEATAAEQVADVEAALEKKDLKRAKAELAEVWSESAVYPEIQRRYEHAEAQAVDALTRKLARVRRPGCKAYNALLAKARALNPARVIAEAANRTPCK